MSQYLSNDITDSLLYYNKQPVFSAQCYVLIFIIIQAEPPHTTSWRIRTIRRRSTGRVNHLFILYRFCSLLVVVVTVKLFIVFPLFVVL